jgi:hypothetical protein
MMRTAVIATALAAALGAGGCGRAHLNPAQGAASRQAFASQQVRPSPQWRSASTGLDPQEADVVAQGYFRGLAGKARTEAPEPVIFVAPQQQGQAAQLAPSVPRN